MEDINKKYYDENNIKIEKIEALLENRIEDKIAWNRLFFKRHSKNKKIANNLMTISKIILFGSLISLSSILTIMAVMGTVPILMTSITGLLLFTGPYMYASAKNKINDNESEMRKFKLSDSKYYEQSIKNYEDELDIRYILKNILEANYISDFEAQEINEILLANQNVHSHFSIEEMLIFLKNTNDSSNIARTLINRYKEDNDSTHDKTEALAILKKVGNDPKITLKLLKEISIWTDELQEYLETTTDSLQNVFNNTYEDEYEEYERKYIKVK